MVVDMGKPRKLARIGTLAVVFGFCGQLDLWGPLYNCGWFVLLAAGMWAIFLWIENNAE